MKKPTREQIKQVLIYSIALKEYIKCNDFILESKYVVLKQELDRMKKWLNKVDMQPFTYLREMEASLYQLPPFK